MSDHAALPARTDSNTVHQTSGHSAHCTNATLFGIGENDTQIVRD